MINGFYNIISIRPNETVDPYGDHLEPLKEYSEDYFGIYFFISEPQTKLHFNPKNTFKSTRNSLNSELRFRKTSVELLSTPYMQECKPYGK